MAFSEKTLDFLFQVKLEDSKPWYDSHKQDYREYVINPMTEFVQTLTPLMEQTDELMVLEPKIGKTLSRVRRDTRFTHDKSLYRDTAWAIFMRSKKLWVGQPAFYMELSPRGYSYGCGYYNAEAEVMQKMRELILADDPAFYAADEAAEKSDVFKMSGEMFKRAKYPQQTQQKSRWLERKNIWFTVDGTDFGFLFSDDFAPTVAAQFEQLVPIYKFFLKNTVSVS